MQKKDVLAEYMELTPGERKRLEQAVALVANAMNSSNGALAASHLQKAARIILQVNQDQFWRML